MSTGPTLPESACPTCGYVMNDATPISDPGASASEGDFLVCAQCGQVMRFTDDLTLRTCRPEELDDRNRELLLDASAHFALLNAMEHLR